MNKFEQAYELVKDEFVCPKNCKICENMALQSLPGEVEYLTKKTQIPKTKLKNLRKVNGHLIWIITKNEKDCSFYRFGHCTKRDIRPLDCRTYPAMPCLRKGKVFVKINRKCPLIKQKKIKKEFVKRALKAWKIANPPKWWLELYKKENE